MAAASIDDIPYVPRSRETPSLRNADARLSLPFVIRLPLGISLAASTGLVLGLAHGSQETGFRFRAENAHRLPKTQTGWYLYHKSKNYNRMLGGIKEGVKMAGRMSGLPILFMGMEEATDRARIALARLRGGDENAKLVSKDFLSTALAGLGTAGAFSAWNHFPVPAAARLAKQSLKWSVAYGLLQDAISLGRGRRLGYVEFVKRHTFGTSEGESHSTAGIVG